MERELLCGHNDNRSRFAYLGEGVSVKSVKSAGDDQGAAGDRATSVWYPKSCAGDEDRLCNEVCPCS